MGVRIARAAVEAAAANPYWREADARVVLTAWRESGLSLAAFARQFGISVQRLRRWHHDLEGPDSVDAVACAPKVHPVQVVFDGLAAAEPAPSAELELVLLGGRRVIVRAGFDADVLARLVRAVESLC